MERIVEKKKVVGKAILVYDQSVIFVTFTGSGILELKSSNILDVVHHAYVLSYNISQTDASFSYLHTYITLKH
jgi:hypothetical protein